MRKTHDYQPLSNSTQYSVVKCEYVYSATSLIWSPKIRTLSINSSLSSSVARLSRVERFCCIFFIVD